MQEDRFEDQLPPWLFTERGLLYTSGLLRYPTEQLTHSWLQELDRIGFANVKDGSQIDGPPEPGAKAVRASNGRQLWITPGTYREDDVRRLAQVWSFYPRTDGALVAMLAVLEGGEGIKLTNGELNLQLLRKDYEAYGTHRNPRVASGAADKSPRKSKHRTKLPNERLLECATALVWHFRPDFDALPEAERRELVVGMARRIHAVAKATRELQEYGEMGKVRPDKVDRRLCVRAAELHDIYGLDWPEVAEALNLREQSGRDKDKVGHQVAESYGKEGRAMMDQAYPEGWLAYAARHKRGGDSQDP